MTETPDWPARIIAWGKFPSLLTGQWARDGVRHYTDETRAYVPEAALAASEERARRAEEERDEARRRRDAWKARASGYEAMRAALAEKAKDVPVMNFSRLMLIALLKDERAENERLRAALAAPTDEEA